MIRRDKYFKTLIFVLFLASIGKSGKASNSTENYELARKSNKSILKTIQMEDGDIIDCLDIYKQPAFDHPLMKGHKIEMRPSFVPESENDGVSFTNLTKLQLWKEDEICPEGTIPIIRRIRQHDPEREKLSREIGLEAEPSNCNVEVAGGFNNKEKPFRGIGAEISAWNLAVSETEWSTNTMSVSNGDKMIEAGWGVSKILFGDDRPRLLINWRAGGNGCFNLQCPGFVHTSQKIPIARVMDPVSEYNGKVFGLRIKMFKDDAPPAEQKWWLTCQDEPVGYWPISVFPWLAEPTEVQWLGKVCNTRPQNMHTPTQMGNGHFAHEGFGKSGSFTNLLIWGYWSKFRYPDTTQNAATNPHCYGVKQEWNYKHGPYIFYGGEGGFNCDK